MRIRKRIAAGFLAGALLLGGCSSEDRSWAFRAGDKQPPVGIYILTMINVASELETELQVQHAEDPDYKTPEKYSQLLKEEYNGTPMPDAIRAEAEKRMRAYIAVEQKFDEMELTLAEEEIASAENTAMSSWADNQAYYEGNGIAEASLRQYLENSFKQQRIFNAYYGQGGEREVPTAELQAALAEFYAKADIMMIQKDTGEEGEAVKKEAEEYLNRLKAGENILDLIYEKDKAIYDAYVKENPDQQDLEEPTRPADGSRTVIISEANRGQFSDELIDAALASTPGEPILVEDVMYYYILNPRDINEDPNTLLNYYDNVLQQLKWDEFLEMAAQWGQELDVEANQAALSRYTPQKLKVDVA